MSAYVRKTTVSNPLESAGIQVMSSEFSNFMPQAELMLGPDRLKAISEILPDSVILCNKTNRYIWSFSLIYRYPDRIMPMGNFREYRLTISPGGATDHTHMLAPNGCFLSTPISGISASYNPDKRQPSLFPDDSFLKAAISKYESEGKQLGKQVVLLVDSVIYEDGEIIGPDSMSEMNRINECISADEEFSASLMDLSGEPLRRKLQQFADIPRTSEYSSRQSDMGSLFLAVVTERGEDVALLSIKRMEERKWFTKSKIVWRRIQ